MFNISRVTRIFFLDWFGSLLDYKRGEGLIRFPFDPQAVPDCFDLALWPIHLPARVRLRQKNYLPTDLPPMEIKVAASGPVKDAPKECVVFHSLENNCYLTSNPFNNELVFQGYEPREWEFFIPLTEEMLRGLSYLVFDQYSEIKNTEGEVMAPCFPLREGFNFQIHEWQFPILKNIDNLSALSNLEKGESKAFDFVLSDGSLKSFSVSLKNRD